MTIDIPDQVERLKNAVDGFVDENGIRFCEMAYVAGRSLLVWLRLLKESECTGHADELLDGVRASIVEAAGCMSLGLARPALFAMRGQIDVALSWLYFKDHPIEWRKVCETGDGFMLKRDVIAYLESYSQSFKSRYGSLQKNATRRDADPYRMLSAHVHSQSFYTIPTYGDLEALVGKPETLQECAELQTDISEYLGDIFLSCFSGKWASLPDEIVKSVKKRLPADQIYLVFN